MAIKTITAENKLSALSMRFYQHHEWEPKAGDYYTSARSDLELYRVVDINDGVVTTEYCHAPGGTTTWPLEGFTTEGFGPMRVFVHPDFVTEQEK